MALPHDRQGKPADPAEASIRKSRSARPGKPHDIMEDRARGRLKRWSCWVTEADVIEFQGAIQAAIIMHEIFGVSGTKVSK